VLKYKAKTRVATNHLASYLYAILN
jgi:hypothetical protein